MLNSSVIVLRYTKRHLEKHPGHPNTRIKIISYSKFEKMESDELPMAATFKKKYKRMLQLGVDGPQHFSAKHLAYRHILHRIHTEGQKGRKIAFDDAPDHSVYIIQLKEEVKTYKPFVLANGEDVIKASTECFYVGLTSQPEILTRYNQHRSEQERTNSVWGRRFFLDPFPIAFRKDLLDDFEAEKGKATRELLSSHAHITESEVCLWLREKGHAAYFN